MSEKFSISQDYRTQAQITGIVVIDVIEKLNAQNLDRAEYYSAMERMLINRLGHDLGYKALNFTWEFIRHRESAHA